MKIYHLRFTLYIYIYLTIEIITALRNSYYQLFGLFLLIIPHATTLKKKRQIMWNTLFNKLPNNNMIKSQKRKKFIFFMVHKFLDYTFHALAYNIKPNLLFIYKAIRYTCQDDYKNYNTIRMTGVPSNNEKHLSSTTSILKFQIPKFMSSRWLKRWEIKISLMVLEKTKTKMHYYIQ